MSKSYATPPAFRQALKDRIKRRADEREVRFNRLRQVILFERFASRVYDACGESVLLKGGLVIELRLSRARTTQDVDFRLEGDLEEHLKEIREAARTKHKDWLTFEVSDPRKLTEHVGDQIVYEAVRLGVRAKIGAEPFGDPFAMDLSVGDRLVSVPESVEGTDIFEFVGVDRVHHRVYPKEAHVAEKVHAWSLPRDRENSRTKDLIDIGLMATELAFEMASLREAIEATFKFRDTHEVPVRLPQIPSSWATQYARIKKEGRELPWPELSDLQVRVDAFLSPILREEPVAKWQPGEESWR